MKYLLLFSCTYIWFTLGTFPSFNQQNDTIIGTWQDSGNPEQVITIYSKEHHYVGVQASDSTQLVLSHVEWKPLLNAYQGFIIHPENGKEVSVTLFLENENTFRFTVGAFLFKRTFRFQRV